MVKLGPKLPPPNRREVAKIEKEQKRLAQLESGTINPAAVGEPREHLLYLLSISKRARVKHPNIFVLEESKRKREKAQKRAVARRAAKNVMKEIIARVTHGSRAHGDDTQDNFHIGVGDAPGPSVSDVPATHAFVEPLAIANLPASPSSGNGTDEHAPTTSGENAAPSSVVNLLDAVLVEAAEVLSQGHPWALLPVIPPMEPLAPDPLSKSSGADNDAPRLEIQISTETDTFWDKGSFTSAAAAVKYEKTEETKADNQATVKSPERHQATLPSQILPPMPGRQSSHRGSQLLDAAGSASQAPPRTRPLSKTEIFSKPLEYSKYSSKPSSTRSSVFQHSSMPVYQLFSTEPRLDGLDRPDTPIPEDYQRLTSPSGSRPPIQCNVSLSSVMPSGVPIAPRAAAMPNSRSPHGWAVRDASTKSPETAEKQRRAGLSAGGVALEGPSASPQGSVPATHVSPFIVEGGADDCPVSHSPVDSIQLTIVGDKFPDMARSRLAVPFGANYERTTADEFQSLAQVEAGGSGRTPIAAQLVTPKHVKAYQDDPAQIVKSASFSSNMSSPRGSDNLSPAAPLPFSAVILQNAGQHLDATNPYYIPPFVPSSNSTVRPLAPAAPIFQDRKIRTGILAERNMNIQRAADLGDLEKGNPEANTSVSNAVADRTTSFGQPKGVQSDVVPHNDTLACPDSPLGERSGIVPPASTPVSTSPLIFSIALPVPPRSRAPILPTHGAHVAEGARDEGGMKGFVSALKWALKKTFGYFWQRRR